MNKLFPVAVILLFAWQVAAQPVPILYEKGYVYMKNGTVLKGKYLFSNDLAKVRVVSGKNLWIFDAADVERVSRTKPERTETPVQEPFTASLSSSPWFNMTELGVLAGNTDNRKNAPLVFGASLNRKIYGNLSAGIGVGAEFFQETYMPVTANFMYRFRDSRITPFASLQAGYQIAVEDTRTTYYQVVPDILYRSSYYPGLLTDYNTEMKARGGMLVNPSFGLLIQSWQGMGLGFSFGYRFHRLSYKSENDYRVDVDFNRLSIKLGIVIY